MNETKEKIIETSLDLFAKKGFNNVSIRDICKIVGIKESSLYYHFVNKQAIFDEILKKADDYIAKRKEIFESQFAKTKEISTSDMCKVACGVMKIYLCDPLIYKIISFLSIERFSSKIAFNEYQRLVFELPLEQQTKTFEQMMDRGFIKKAEPLVLAQEYYSVIYFSFQKNCLGAELTDEVINKSYLEISKNIGDLYERWRAV